MKKYRLLLPLNHPDTNLFKKTAKVKGINYYVVYIRGVKYASFSCNKVQYSKAVAWLKYRNKKNI